MMNRSITNLSLFMIQEHPESAEFLRNGIFMDELLPVLEAPKNSDGVQNNQFSTNEQNDGFWNSIFFTTDEFEAFSEVLGSKQQNVAAQMRASTSP